MKETKRKAFVLVVMVLLLGFIGLISGTSYAKYYQTQSIGTQQATIAKWGVVINVDTSDFFGKNYNAKGEMIKNANDASITVKGAEAVVAPGTKGAINFTVSGNAEINVAIKVLLKDANFQDIVLVNTEGQIIYKPIRWYVVNYDQNGNATYNLLINETNSNNVLELFAEMSSKHAAGTTINVKHGFAWEWIPERNSEYDTILGELAEHINEPEYTVTLNNQTFKVSDCKLKVGYASTVITVEQIQSMD